MQIKILTGKIQVLSKKIVDEVFKDSPLIDFTHVNIESQKGQFLSVKFMNNDKTVFAAHLYKDYIDDFIKQLSICENKNDILYVNIHEGAYWFINYALVLPERAEDIKEDL